jgi:hypothetical protein
VGPVEDSTRSAQDQEHGGRNRRRPRTRGCLLKGCGQRFRPVEARDRYCSQQCRQAARQWSRWKAQQSYRATAAGKEKRNGQSRRYRERVKERKPARQNAVSEAARVITKSFFSTTVATVPAAMRDSHTGPDHHSDASVRTHAGAPWNASGNGSDAGVMLRDHC